jgi:hypothetical protein
LELGRATTGSLPAELGRRKLVGLGRGASGADVGGLDEHELEPEPVRLLLPSGDVWEVAGWTWEDVGPREGNVRIVQDEGGETVFRITVGGTNGSGQ